MIFLNFWYSFQRFLSFTTGDTITSRGSIRPCLKLLKKAKALLPKLLCTKVKKDRTETGIALMLSCGSKISSTQTSTNTAEEIYFRIHYPSRLLFIYIYCLINPKNNQTLLKFNIILDRRLLKKAVIDRRPCKRAQKVIYYNKYNVNLSQSSWFFDSDHIIFL